MDGYPVTIRTLDPPLHEFVPQAKEEREKLAKPSDRRLRARLRRDLACQVR